MVRGTTLLVAVGILRLAVGPESPGPSAGGPSPMDDALPELLDETRAAVDEAARRGTALGKGERIDPNRATEVELDRLPGVGPSTALAIIAARDRDGGFRRPEDLLRVRGIGPATLERIRVHLDFGAGVPASLRRGSRSTPRGGDARISLNDATAEELQTLSGIGPALSARILAYRKERGGFGTIDELLEVSGIGPATLGKIRERLRLGR